MTPYFPLFLSLEGRGIVVIGGGAVAARRIEKLLPFQPHIMVVSPELHPSLLLLAEQEKITWECREYRSGDCSGAFLVLAATDDPQVNKRAGEEARDAGILCNRADSREDCDFYFPGLVQTDQLVVGVTGDGTNHRLVKAAVEQITQLFWREEPHETAENPANRQP